MRFTAKLKTLIWRYLPKQVKLSITRNQLLNMGDATIIYGNRSFNVRVREAIEQIRPDLLDDTRKYEEMREMMAYGYARWHAHPMEFLLMGMDTNPDKTNSEMLTDFVRDEIVCGNDGYEKFYELSYKYGVYARLKKFFGRECMKIDKDTTFEEFKQFASRHLKMFIKPERGSFGRGAHIYETRDEQSLYEKFKELSHKQWIVEELIVQHPDMAKWNPTSVNTVRVPSVMTSRGPVIMAPAMRCGRRGAIIDNAGGGGIVLCINELTGEIEAPGRTEDGKYHTCHPDSGKEFAGNIPLFDELKKFVIAVHNAMPDHKYLGNDYALTPQGWILIECNWGQFIAQYASGKGVKTRFVELMNS